MARGFDSIEPGSQGGDRLKPNEIWDTLDLPKQSGYNTYRFLPGDLLPIKIHWIKILAGKDKRETKIPKICVSFDPDNEKVPRKGTDCPYCKLSQGQEATCQTSTAYYSNAIVRNLQEDEPRKKGKPTKEEKKTGFKELNSKAWTPVRVLRLPGGLAGKIKGLKELNVVKGKQCDVSDAKHGMDVNIKFDPKAAGADKYQIAHGDKNSLSEEELGYLTYDLGDEAYSLMGRETQEHAESEFARMDIVGGTDLDDDEDDLKKKKKKGKKDKKGKKSKKSSLDDDDDDDDEDDDDEDDLKKSKKSKSKKSKKSKKSSLDDDDDDDDDKPAKKKGKKSKSKKSSLDDDDDDEDDKPAKKSKSKKSKSKKSSLDDDDDDEDDKPAKKSKSKKSVTKKSKSSDSSSSTRKKRKRR